MPLGATYRVPVGAATPAPVRPAGRLTLGARWNTPARIRALATVCLLATLIVLVVTQAALGGVRSGLRIIGHRAAPEVTSTSGVYFALNDMDAQVANVLLVGSETTLGVTRQQSLGIYETDRRTADADLQQAAVQAGTSPAAIADVRAVLDALGQYEALAAQAVLLEQQAAAPTPGRPPAALLSFRQSTDVMHATLLPAAKRLTDSNASTLDKTYSSRRSGARRALLAVVSLGGAMLLALLGFQLFLTLRMRRLFNPALGAATLVAGALVVASGITLNGELRHLRVAKQDAFDSLVVLSQARAVSYDANADESRYLVDPDRAAQYQQAFLDKTQQVVGLPGATIATYDARFADAVDAYQANNSDLRFQGYLGSEFRNITFTGERQAAEDTLAAYRIYQRDDRRIRALNASGDLREAIRFDTSYAPADSNGAYTTYDNALVKLTAINQDAFDDAIRAGEHQLRGWAGIPWVACGVVALLVLLGTRPRLAEYH